MDFVSNQEAQIADMLAVIGISRVEELFTAIPEKLRLAKPTLDDGLSEYEGLCFMEDLASKNTFQRFENYLGAGAYEHHVPALVGAICAKSEFLTAYTPYQAEISQGMLQVIFEFQSAICALTGLDVSNASLYDGASACAEGLLMALRLQKRTKIVVAGTLHPHYRAVVKQYLDCHDVHIEEIPFESNGKVDLKKMDTLFDGDTAAVLIQSPNFFGVIEDVSAISQRAKEKGILTVLCANPLAYGIYASAAELGADIAVGDCQPLGLPLQYGGPYVGYIACRQEYVRQMPGRIVGETVDTEGNRGFVLTLQAREQHIRREKATSNICTNQALAALASLVAILWYGKEGMRKLALTNFQRTSYLKAELAKLSGLTLLTGDLPLFNEFAVKFSLPINEVQAYFREQKIEPGLDLGRYYPNSPALKGYMLVCVTETKSKKQLDRFIEVAQKLSNLERKK